MEKSKITALVVSSGILDVWCVSFVKESAVLPGLKAISVLFFPVEQQMSWGSAWHFLLTIWRYYPVPPGRR